VEAQIHHEQDRGHKDVVHNPSMSRAHINKLFLSIDLKEVFHANYRPSCLERYPPGVVVVVLRRTANKKWLMKFTPSGLCNHAQYVPLDLHVRALRHNWLAFAYVVLVDLEECG